MIRINKRSGQYYRDLGANKPLEIRPALPDEDGQLRKVVSTGISGKYKLIGKAGNQIAYTANANGDIDANCFYTTDSTENTYRFDKREDGNWQIYSHGESSYINKKTTGREFTDIRFGKTTNPNDSGNSVIFIPEANITYRLPVFSTEAQSTWYYIGFQKQSSKNIQSNGENADVTQVEKAATNKNQFWKFTGTWDSAKIVNSDGLELKLVDKLYQTVAVDSGDAHSFFRSNENNTEIGWRFINKSLESNRIVNDYEGKGTKVGTYHEDAYGGNAVDITPVPLLPFDFVIEAGAEASANDYTKIIFNDVIFKSTDTATGQLTGANSLTPGGKVKLVKTFKTDQWYPIGFPFEVNNDSVIIKYGTTSVKGVIYDGDKNEHEFTNDGSDDYNFFVKKYDATENYFVFNDAIAANSGYLVEFPAGEFGDTTEVEVTFVSTESPLLNIGETGISILSAETNLAFVANSNVSNINCFEYAMDYYQYNSVESRFIRLNSAKLSPALKPFEAIIAVKTNTPESEFPSSIGDGSGFTAIKESLPEFDIREVRYYTLQGVRIDAPKENGVYIVKKTYVSCKTDVSKIIVKK